MPEPAAQSPVHRREPTCVCQAKQQWGKKCYSHMVSREGGAAAGTCGLGLLFQADCHLPWRPTTPQMRKRSTTDISRMFSARTPPRHPH